MNQYVTNLKKLSIRLVNLAGIIFILRLAILGIMALDKDAENYHLFEATRTVLDHKMEVGMTREEVSDLLREYDFIRVDHSVWWESNDGEFNEIGPHFIVNMGGDPTGSGDNSHCSWSIYFIDNGDGTTTVSEIGDRLTCDA